MIPQTPSAIVPVDSSAQQLLRRGPPFVEFPRYSILDLIDQRDLDDSPVPFSEWLTKRLQGGKPFVIQDFQRLDAWDQQFFDIEKLIELSTKKNIPIRNCSTGRDLSFTLRKFAESARQSYQEFQNLYARDLTCPQEWQERCRQILPTEVQWGGRLDLFQWLPAAARSEVMMAYVGSEGSSSGFHRCFSSTVALNLLVDSDDRSAVCIGTDFVSQKKYDAFMSARGISPHVDWLNLGPDDLMKADFPLYAYDQKVGDLVVFPPATAHQVWNPSTLSTKLVWNILHPLSLEVGIQYVQPPFNRLCHPDVARTNLSLACAMLSLRETSHATLPPDLPLLSRLFRQMVHEESIEGELAAPINHITLPSGEFATCNFCGTAFWNRHVRCGECTDFDLCLPCYLNGRSCEHIQNYTWAEMVRPDECTQILNRAREILGFQLEEPRTPDRSKTLGTAVNDLMRSKRQTVQRLCHLCRIDHAEWKGRRCDKCTAFFCYRGLYRHFDINSVDVLRHAGLWNCPKCLETCNCRCCHFSTAYTKAEKPASKRRVKPADARGRVMGFTDNVFDQKRGNRTTGAANPPLPSVAQITGKKRPISSSEGPLTPLRKIELPTPEPDLGRSIDMHLSREGSDFPFDHPFGSVYAENPLTGLLPSMKTFPDQRSYSSSPVDGRRLRKADAPGGMATLASAAVSQGRVPVTLHQMENTLAPMLSRATTAQPISERSGPPGLSMAATASLHSVPSASSSSAHHLSRAANGYGEPASSSTLNDHMTVSSFSNSISPSTTATSMSLMDSSIQRLEEKILALRQYEKEFLVLDLEDSHKLLSTQLRHLELELRDRKREKSLQLIDQLEREGFHGLAEGVKKEIERVNGGSSHGRETWTAPTGTG